MLGFSTYSEKSLATKMAQTTDQVLGFLNDLASKAKPQGEREVEELRQFAESEFASSSLSCGILLTTAKSKSSICLKSPMKSCALTSQNKKW